MGTPFLGTATGDPINLVRRMAPQAALGVPASTAFRDGRQFGGRLGLNPGTVDAQALNPSGATVESLAGKVEFDPGDIVFGDLDPNHPHLLIALANLLRKYSVAAVADGGTGFQRWRYDRGQATAGAPYVSILEQNDVLPPHLFHDLAIGGLQISAAAGGSLVVSTPGGQMGGYGYTWGGAAVQRGGAGSTLPLSVKASPLWRQISDTLGSHYVRIVTIPDADDAFTYQTILADAGTTPVVGDFTGATWAGKLGEAARIYRADDTRVGRLGEQASFVLPVGATLVADDIFELPRRTTEVIASPGIRYAVAAVDTVFYLDGSEIRTEGGWTLRIFRESVESIPDVAGRQTSTPQLAGSWIWEVELSRQVVDLTIQAALHDGLSLAVYLEAESEAPIPGTDPARPFRLIAGLPSARGRSSMYGVDSGARNREESIVLRGGVPAAAGSHAGFSWDQDGAIILENERTAL